MAHSNANIESSTPTTRRGLATAYHVLGPRVMRVT